jgi:hypothetical protein
MFKLFAFSGFEGSEDISEAMSFFEQNVVPPHLTCNVPHVLNIMFPGLKLGEECRKFTFKYYRSNAIAYSQVWIYQSYKNY